MVVMMTINRVLVTRSASSMMAMTLLSGAALEWVLVQCLIWE